MHKPTEKMGTPVHLRTRLIGFAFALGIGSVGGAIFAWAQFPLAWMLGAMCACTLASMLRAPILPLVQVRPFMTAIVGVLLGGSFSPSLLGSLAGWLPTLVSLIAYVAVCAIVGTLYFRWVGKFDSATAFFSAMPGGVVEMMIVSEENGGDGRMVALVHSARILFVVASLPLIISLISGEPIVTGASAGGRPRLLDTAPGAGGLLIACGLSGMYLGRLLRLPAKYLLGPMLVSALVHVVGITDVQPPLEAIVLAQIVLGTLVGCRFCGVPPAKIGRILVLSAGSVAIMLGFAIAFALGLVNFMPYPVEAILLAYAPGGLNEMSLVALAMDIEVAFVSGHHIVRVVLIFTLAQFLFGCAKKIGAMGLAQAGRKN